MKRIATQIIYPLIIIMVFPSVSFAAWWNPFSWIGRRPAPVSAPIIKSQPIEASATVAPTRKKESLPKAVDAAPVKSVKAVIKEQKKSDVSPAQALGAMALITVPASQPHAMVPIVPAAPIGTLCNGTYYTKCPDSQDFVCPSAGSAYCQLPPQQQLQQNSALVEDQILQEQRLRQEALQRQLLEQQAIYQARQDKINQANAQIMQLRQQILSIKSQYYQDKVGIEAMPIAMNSINGKINKLLNEANQKIEMINIQIQQIQLNNQ